MARVAVLMSGGVDSSAAAWLLKDRGHDVVGITARMWDGGSRCCDLDDVYRAERVCHRLAIPHVVLDLTGDFESEVVGPFIDCYLEGRTPNPCAHCNREVKLGRMVGLLVRAGFDRVATGHYARITSVGDVLLLAEPADTRKSQVYFLSLVRPDVLRVLEFPLEDDMKADVSTLVRTLGLPAREGESQDLCFVGSGRYEDLLKDRIRKPGPGRVLDTDGREVATHRGHYAYTVGQRFGLQGKRYYVLEKRATTNEIVIGEREEALMSRITVADVNLFLPPERLCGEDLMVKYRYNSAPVGARIDGDGCGTPAGQPKLTVVASEPCFAPAPGQILAGYHDDCLVFGGIIESADR